MEINCDTCEHTGKRCLEEPCRSCNWRLNRWEPKESGNLEMGKTPKDTYLRNQLTSEKSGSEATAWEPAPVDVRPDYYHKNGIECFQSIDAATSGLQGADAFDTGNALKYLWRWKDKGGVEDLKKAIVYIQRIIDREEPHAN